MGTRHHVVDLGLITQLIGLIVMLEDQISVETVDLTDQVLEKRIVHVIPFLRERSGGGPSTPTIVESTL